MCFTKKNIIKPGVLYHDIIPYLRPFDIILFNGDTIMSEIISILSKRNEYPRSDEFTHAGIIVTSDILEHPNVEPGKFYLYESTANLFSSYRDINGKKRKLGVQVRELEGVINDYDKDKTAVTYCRLINNPIEKTPMSELKSKFMDFYLRYNDNCYDVNLLSLFASIIPFLRRFRDPVEEFTNTTDWLFCSELVAMLLKHVDVYPPEVNPKDVVPRDIAFPEADTELMPKIISHIIYVTTPKYYNGIDHVIL